MLPRNSAFRRARVRRLMAALSAALLTVLDGSGALGAAARPAPAGAAQLQPVVPRPAGPVRALLDAFPYVHGARPLPSARPGERTVFTLKGEPLTLRQLQALPAVRYRTRHLQLGRSVTYEGAPLRDLAARGGFLGRDVRISASNGFSATIRAADYLHEPIMLAYRADGRPIPVLDKGPLTVVLPPGPARFTSPPYAAAWVWFAVALAPLP